MEQLSGIKVEENTLYGVDVEESMSHIDVIFARVKATLPMSNIQGGLWNYSGDVLISVIRRGAFVFRMDKTIYPTYLAEKLHLDLAEAKVVRELFIRLRTK